jgi:hypothetical protein
MPRKTRHLINLTSKLQVSPNFTPDSVADEKLSEENATLVVFQAFGKK